MKNSKLKRERRNVQNNTTAELVEDFPVVVKQEVKEEEEYNTIKTRLRSNVVVDQQRISPRTAPLPVVTSKAIMPKYYCTICERQYASFKNLKNYEKSGFHQRRKQAINFDHIAIS